MTNVVAFVALLLPFLSVVLVGIWMGSALTSYSTSGETVTSRKIAGFSWTTGELQVFNWHPLLMTIGFVFCSTVAALSYISLPFSRKTNKLIHLTAHGVGAVTSFGGALAVFKFHNDHQIKNLYSLHSWLGALTWVFFTAQWVFGFVTFFHPGARPQVRATRMSYHIASGIAILALVYITAATGVVEKLAFNGSCYVTGKLNGQGVVGYSAPDCLLGNAIGLVLVLSLIVAVTTIVHAKVSDQRRQSKPHEETSPLVEEPKGKNKGKKAYHDV